MNSFKISQIQFQAEATPDLNAQLLKKYFYKTRKFNPDLICTPECSNIITSDRNHLIKYSTLQKNCPIIFEAKKFANQYRTNIHLGSLLLKVAGRKKLVNRSILINKNGKVQNYYDKIHLFDVNIDKVETHRESSTFIKGKKIVITTIAGIKIGFTICYDLRFPNLYRKLAKKGAHIILIPAAFTVPTGKAHWETLVRSRAIENSVFVIATNMCGTHHNNRKTYGYSYVFDPWGNKLNKSLSKPKILNTVIDLDNINKFRSKIPSILS
tara:strand:- start:5772 stop:6575 length:804 start_codon:yes stop_codon:yes gene_type:complete